MNDEKRFVCAMCEMLVKSEDFTAIGSSYMHTKCFSNGEEYMCGPVIEDFLIDCPLCMSPGAHQGFDCEVCFGDKEVSIYICPDCYGIGDQFGCNTCGNAGHLYPR